MPDRAAAGRSDTGRPPVGSRGVGRMPLLLKRPALRGRSDARSCRDSTGFSRLGKSTAMTRAGKRSLDYERAPAHFVSVLESSGKQLGRLRLRFLIGLGVVFQRQIELLAELGRLGIRERVHGAGIGDDAIVRLRRVEVLLERLVLLLLHERIVRAVEDEDLRLDGSRSGRGCV